MLPSTQLGSPPGNAGSSLRETERRGETGVGRGFLMHVPNSFQSVFKGFDLTVY